MEIFEHLPNGTLKRIQPLDKAKHQTADKALQKWVSSEGTPGKHYLVMNQETQSYKALLKRMQVAQPMGAEDPEEKPKPKSKAKVKAAPKK